MNSNSPTPLHTSPPKPCDICGSVDSFTEYERPGLCKACMDRYGPALVHAHTSAPADYAIRLAGGDVYRCAYVVLKGDWVELYGVGSGFAPKQHPEPFPFPLGLSVPIWQVLWFAPMSGE